MDFTLIPYELLQHISSNLLPRYQCRLAMASTWCYKYLYNDLLRWHARKDAILVPKYKCVNDHEYRDMSLVEFNKQIILYELSHDYTFYIHNLTYQYMRRIYVGSKKYKIPKYNMDVADKMIVCSILKNTNMLTGCYKYINISILILYLESKHPLLSMPREIHDNIMHMLSDLDQWSFIYSNKYLSSMYSWQI